MDRITQLMLGLLAVVTLGACERESTVERRAYDFIEVGSGAFTLNDVERACEVYRYDRDYGEIECRGSSLRVVEKKCEAYFSGGWGSNAAEIECRGSGLRRLESRCTAVMYTDDYAEIDCF